MTRTQTFTYSYDAASNRTSQTYTDVDGVSETTSYTYNGANQITKKGYRYDKAGNLTHADRTKYSYDGANRLISFSDPVGRIIGEYVYNGAGDRLAQEVNGSRTEYLLDASHPLTEVLGAFGAGEPTYYLLGLDVIGSQTGQDWSYFGYDGLGSTRFVTDSLGAMTSATRYDPYGGILDQLSTINTNLGFAGEFTDANGLINLRARFYSPSLGTFLNRDPVLGQIGGMSVRWNPYIYAGGNPINNIDPNGQFFFGSPFAMSVGFNLGALGSVGNRLLDNLTNGYDWNCGIDLGSALGAGLRGALNPLDALDHFGRMFKRVADAHHELARSHWLADMALSVAFEPYDWVTTLNSWGHGDFHALDLVGLLPLIPARGIRRGVKALKSGRVFDSISDVLRRGEDVARRVRRGLDDLAGNLRGKLQPAGAPRVWDDTYDPRMLRMADDGEGRLPRQKGFDELPGGDDFAQLPSRRGTPRIGSQTGDTARNAAELNRRMEAAYIPRPEGDVAAHHIVPSTDPKAYDVREKLADLGIDINSAANGVYMLQPAHRALHGKRNYIRAVTERLSRVKTKEEGIAALDRIRQLILSGNFPQRGG